MATPVNKIYGHQLQLGVKLTSNATTFTNYALVTSDKGFTISGTQTEDPQIDLDDQSKPAVITRRGQSSDTGFTGSGMLHANTVAHAMNWAQEQTPLECEIKIGNAATITGMYILSSFEVSGSREEAVTSSLSLVQAERPTITPGTEADE